MEDLSGVVVGQAIIIEGSNNSEMVGKVLRIPKGEQAPAVRGLG